MARTLNSGTEPQESIWVKDLQPDNVLNQRTWSRYRRTMGQPKSARVFFATRDDANELIKALSDEGFQTALTDGESETAAWVLTVDPFDDRVADMVDVYGGWLPDEV